jgi:hypothetical protein
MGPERAFVSPPARNPLNPSAAFLERERSEYGADGLGGRLAASAQKSSTVVTLTFFLAKVWWLTLKSSGPSEARV